MSASFSATVPIERASQAEVRLVEYDPESETKILAGIIFQQTHGSWDDALARAQGARRVRASGNSSSAICRNDRRDGKKSGALLRMPICDSRSSMDIGSYRDLAPAPHDDAGTPELFHASRLQHAARIAAGRAWRRDSKKRWNEPIVFSGRSNRSIAISLNMPCRSRIGCGFISGRIFGSCSGRRN